MISKILAPVDGSEHSRKALEFACELSEKFDAQLFLLYIMETGAEERSIAMGRSVVTFDAIRDDLKKTGRMVLNVAIDIARQTGAKVEKSELDAGPPARRILDHAQKNSIDTIVMGSRGLSDLSGLLLGSVSHKVSHLAECTCITVR